MRRNFSTCRLYGGFLGVLAGIVLTHAAHAQAASRAEGAKVFATSGCAHCHGATGEGTDSGPSLREVRRKLKPAQIQRQIVAGGGEMPAFGTALDAEQVKALVMFLRAKVWVAAPVEPATKADADHGG